MNDFLKISYTKDGKNFNSYGDELVSCRLCFEPTISKGTKLCDSCWELETRISSNLSLAKKIIEIIERR